jgi:hypothetical protein
MATRRTTKPKRRSRRRVWVKSHCRKRPEAAWRKTNRINRDMPF